MKKKRNIRKLTPAILKKIIREERERINNIKNRPKRESNKSKKIEKALRETRKKQIELVKQFRKLHMLRERIKKLS